MKIIAFLVGLFCAPVWAASTIIAGQNAGGHPEAFSSSAGQMSITLLAGEDETNDVIKVEHQYSFEAVTADNEIGSGAGFIHTITCATSAGSAATAGAITLYDNTAESGTTIAVIGIPATAFVPFTLTLDMAVSNGIYVGYDGTVAGVGCTVSYR